MPSIRTNRPLKSPSYSKNPSHNHIINIEGGVMAEECGAVLQAFFRSRR